MVAPAFLWRDIHQYTERNEKKLSYFRKCFRRSFGDCNTRRRNRWDSISTSLRCHVTAAGVPIPWWMHFRYARKLSSWCCMTIVSFQPHLSICCQNHGIKGHQNRQIDIQFAREHHCGPIRVFRSSFIEHLECVAFVIEYNHALTEHLDTTNGTYVNDRP